MTTSENAVERAFAFVRLNERPAKPRRRGVTEIRGPYYAPVGHRYLSDVLESMGRYVDTLKYAGGSFALMPRGVVRSLNELCHEHEVEVSTGGFLEYVLTQGPDAVAHYPATTSSDSRRRFTRPASSQSQRSESSLEPAALRRSKPSKLRGRAT